MEITTNPKKKTKKTKNHTHQKMESLEHCSHLWTLCWASIAVPLKLKATTEASPRISCARGSMLLPAGSVWSWLFQKPALNQAAWKARPRTGQALKKTHKNLVVFFSGLNQPSWETSPSISCARFRITHMMVAKIHCSGIVFFHLCSQHCFPSS